MKRTAKAAKHQLEVSVAILTTHDTSASDKVFHEVAAALRLARKEAREREAKRAHALIEHWKKGAFRGAKREQVGRQLANIAHNWKQRPGHVLTAADCLMLERLQKEWDNT